MKRALSIVAVASCLALLAGCGSDGEPAAATPTQPAASVTPSVTSSVSDGPHLLKFLKAATPETLVGTWQLALLPGYEGGVAKTLPLVVETNGTWHLEGGCPKDRGTWVLGADGALTATSEHVSFDYCGGAESASQWVGETNARLMDGALHLFPPGNGDGSNETLAAYHPVKS